MQAAQVGKLEEQRDRRAAEHADEHRAHKDQAEGADRAEELRGADGADAVGVLDGRAELHDRLEEHDCHRVVEHALAEDERVQSAPVDEDGELARSTATMSAAKAHASIGVSRPASPPRP